MNKIDKTNLTDKIKFRLNEINKIENYFASEINQIKSSSKKLSKYVAAFDYIGKILIVFLHQVEEFIISSVSVVGAPTGIVGTSFTLMFSLPTGIIKKLLSITRNKKKHDKILMLAKNKVNSIETSVSQALIDMEISHEEFITNLQQKDKYEKMKENFRNVNEKLEEKTGNTRLNSVNSKT